MDQDLALSQNANGRNWHRNFKGRSVLPTDICEWGKDFVVGSVLVTGFRKSSSIDQSHLHGLRFHAGKQSM